MIRLRVLLFVLMLPAVSASARNVWFVDNARTAAADGTAANPFTTIAQAETIAREADVIYVAEGAGPYNENVILKPRQLFIGSAYGLDAVRDELHVTDLQAPPTPAAQGTGPIIHGSIWLPGDNVVAGCTITVDSGTALAASSPQGAITIRRVYIHVTKRGTAIYLQNPAAPVSIEGGGIDSLDQGGGFGIDGGYGNVTVDKMTIGGVFSTAILVRNRTGGAVTFRRGSRVHVDDASHDAIVIGACSGGSVAFEDPIQVTTHGGRGIVVAKAKRVVFSSGENRVESFSAAAVDFRDSGVEASFAALSADRAGQGHLIEGMVVNHITGKVAVAGGTIRNAESYGIRLEQSSDIRIVGINVVDSGTALNCAEDLVQTQNVRCRAGLFLRHVSRSRIENVTVTGGSGVGVNGNNLADVTFDNLHVSHTGESATDAALLIQEVVGNVTCSRCSMSDGTGGELMIEQRFNSGRLLLDRCTFAAPERPAASPFLVRVQTTGSGRLDLDLRDAQFQDNNGGAVSIDARNGSAVSLSLSNSISQRLGGGLLDAVAQQTAHSEIVVRGTQIIAPGARGGALVHIAAGRVPSDAAAVCVDLAANNFTIGSGAFPVQMTARGGTLHVVAPGAPSEPAALGAAVGQLNGGATVAIDAPAAAVTAVASCR